MRTKTNKVPKSAISDLTPKKDVRGGGRRAHIAGRQGVGGNNPDNGRTNNPEFPPFLPQ